MIVKELAYPLIARKIEAVLRRLNQNHEKRKWLEEELSKILAGYYGEQSLQYYLSFLNPEQYFILQNIRLPSVINQYHFQMDLLILCKKFILIAEIKNFAGTITYEPEFQQLIRQHKNTEKAFKDPVSQVNQQKYQLIKRLEKLNLTIIPPILNLVILSNSQTIIKSSNPNTSTSKQIIRPEKLYDKLSEFANKYQKECITVQEIKKLTKSFLKDHEEQDFNILERFHLTEHELIKGVHCTKCFSAPMLKYRYYWYCPKCNLKNKDAHLQTLRDYYLIKGASITNAAVRDFLQISSRYTAKRILQTLNCKYTGSTKGTIYFLPFQQQ